MPYPPMHETLVLYSFEENESHVEEHKEIFKKVKEHLKSVSEEESGMFNNFIFSAILIFYMRSTSLPFGLA